MVLQAWTVVKGASVLLVTGRGDGNLMSWLLHMKLGAVLAEFFCATFKK